MPPAAQTVCDLCGLPVRQQGFSLDQPNQTYRFCCAGCRQVFILLNEAPEGLDPEKFARTPLFDHCRKMGLIPSADPVSVRPPPKPRPS